MLRLAEISELIPTHNRLRDPKSVKFFEDFLERGCIFRCQKKPITLIKFEDEKIYIRDGHRRLSAVFRVGADLLDVEYKIEDSTYKRYMEAHYHTGWFTPFDVRTHCRLPDFFDFKDKALQIHQEIMSMVEFPTPYSTDRLDEFVKNNFDQYCEVRKVQTLKELVDNSFK